MIPQGGFIDCSRPGNAYNSSVEEDSILSARAFIGWVTKTDHNTSPHTTPTNAPNPDRIKRMDRPFAQLNQVFRKKCHLPAFSSGSGVVVAKHCQAGCLKS